VPSWSAFDRGGFTTVVAAGDEAQEEGGWRAGEQGSVDEPKDGGAREAPVVDKAWAGRATSDLRKPVSRPGQTFSRGRGRGVTASRACVSPGWAR
jgi:hypothetical protein